MPTVQDIRIDFEITQPRLLLNAVDGVNPTDYAYIVFSQWYKGDKGDPGRDGSDGHDGVDGTDGFSPTVETTTISGGTQVTITDAVGAHTFNVTNGTDGQDGTNGQDGFSPVVTVTTTADGHEVTITDAVGDHTFDVTDGHDGVGIPQTLSLDGNELTLSDGGGTITLPDGLPSQTGQSGKFLTTDGTDASWEEVQDTSFVCNFTITSLGEIEQQISCDKSIAEIVAAYQSGQNVRGIVEETGASSFQVFLNVAEDNYVVFQNIIIVFGAHIVSINGNFDGDSDSWDFDFASYSEVAFSGDYEDLLNKPELGTASALDVAESGNASTTQVVKGDDTRLSDARTPTEHTHTVAQITDLPSIDTAPVADSDNLITSGGVFTSIQNVIEVAEGKTATYTLSYSTTGNTDFNSQNNSITVSSFTDTAGNTITDEDVKVGDIVLVVEVDVPDRWVQSIDTTNHTMALYKMETSKIDLTNYVDLTSAQTITGDKTIDYGTKFKFKTSNDNNYNFSTDSNNNLLIDYSGTTVAYLKNNSVLPGRNNAIDLGTSNYRWNNLYLAGSLRDGNNANYGLALPDTTSFTANKTIATTDQITTITIERYI